MHILESLSFHSGGLRCQDVIAPDRPGWSQCNPQWTELCIRRNKKIALRFPASKSPESPEWKLKENSTSKHIKYVYEEINQMISDSDANVPVGAALIIPVRSYQVSDTLTSQRDTAGHSYDSV